MEVRVIHEDSRFDLYNNVTPKNSLSTPPTLTKEAWYTGLLSKHYGTVILQCNPVLCQYQNRILNQSCIN